MRAIPRLRFVRPVYGALPARHYNRAPTTTGPIMFLVLLFLLFLLGVFLLFIGALGYFIMSLSMFRAVSSLERAKPLREHA
jgi:hypothetical protein